MKLSLIAALAIGSLAAGTTATLAQSTNTPPPQENHKKGEEIAKRLQQVADELGLSEQQREQARPIIRGFFEQARSLRQDTSLTQEDRRQQLRTLREETAAKLKPILTPEQLEKWQNMRAARGGGKKKSE